MADIVEPSQYLYGKNAAHPEEKESLYLIDIDPHVYTGTGSILLEVESMQRNIPYIEKTFDVKAGSLKEEIEDFLNQIKKDLNILPKN